jgi:hypothetical protein
MIHPRVFHRLRLLPLFLLATTAPAQFTLFSQNTLHLGWGQNPYYTTKNTYMNGCVVTSAPGVGCVASTWDVAILQEVMNGNELNSGTPLYPQPPAPGAYQVFMTGYQGKSTYREAYAFLVRNPVNAGDCCAVTLRTADNLPITVYGGGNFSRPPAGIVVAEHGRETWILDYHAIFGNVTARRTEVGQVGDAIVALQAVLVGNTPGHTVQRFIAGGDWNFPDTDTAFTDIQTGAGVNISIQPTGLTSLNPAGALSSAYDHFVWAPTLVTLANPVVVQPPGGKTLPQFRTSFSDHLGISVSVQ